MFVKKVTTYEIDLKGTDKHRAGQFNTRFFRYLDNYTACPTWPLAFPADLYIQK